jgi:FkbM family methyltransferase
VLLFKIDHDSQMNIVMRQLLKYGLERAAQRNAKDYPQVACFSQDVISRKIMIDGIFERNELIALKSFLMSEPNPREICLDIGNIGNHAVFFASLFEQVISFEPNHKTFQLLAINSQIANNITAVNLGISDQTGTLPAKVNYLNLGGAQITDAAQANTEFSVMALDEYLQNKAPRPISCIKMDIEGYELKALQGATETLQKHQPMLVLEFHVKKDKTKTDAILSFLAAQGYGYAHIFKPNFFSRAKPKFVKVPLSGLENYPTKNHKMVVFTFD